MGSPKINFDLKKLFKKSFFEIKQDGKKEKTELFCEECCTVQPTLNNINGLFICMPCKLVLINKERSKGMF